jgi:hypothetical protein
MNFNLEPDFDEKTGLIAIEGESMVIHCHFYNVFLLQAIELASYIDGKAILFESAEKSVRFQLENYFKNCNITDEKDKLQVGGDMFKKFGFGLLDFSGISVSGGKVKSNSGHIALGWKKNFGEREEPVDIFACGFIAGVLGATYQKPVGSYKVTELECIIQGKDACIFEVTEK